MNVNDDEVVRKSLEEARATVARTKYLNPEPPLVVFEREWRRPEREEPSNSYKLDTNITAAVEVRCAYLEQRCEFLEGKLAEILPAIATFMENTAKEWNALKSSNAQLVKANEELQKRLTDQQRTHALDIRACELAHQADILQLREARHKANVNG